METNTITTTTSAKVPPKDTRYKTEDVTATKGLTFQDFGLSQEVQLVSKHFLVNIFNLGYL